MEIGTSKTSFRGKRNNPMTKEVTTAAVMKVHTAQRLKMVQQTRAILTSSILFTGMRDVVLHLHLRLTLFTGASSILIFTQMSPKLTKCLKVSKVMKPNGST